MVCVAIHESALKPTAINGKLNRNGSVDYGLFQINDKVWGEKCDVDRLMDPKYNTECAKIVYDNQGLEAWYGYKKHKKKCDNYKAKAAVCPKTRVVNITERSWDERDDQVLKTATNTCREHYAPNVCLVEFRRFDDYHYHAICGREVDE